MERQPERIDARAVAASFVDLVEDAAIKRGYLRWFDRTARVLDVGCGGGAFLDLLRDAGRSGVGIDVAEAAVAACCERGHDAKCGDAIEIVRGLAAQGEEFDGVLVAHVVEHLEPERAGELLVGLAGIVRPGGRVVIVTPNVRNAIVLEETFWLDPAHVRPYPRALLTKLCEAAGLEVVASYDDPATRPRRPWWRRALAGMRSFLSGADRSAPMDAVVVAERCR